LANRSLSLNTACKPLPRQRSRVGAVFHLLILADCVGADDATVIAALLHDIGQFLPHSTAQEMMHEGQSVGKRSHDAIGELYLRDLGFPEKVCVLVGAHVVAKK
jgi:putative nucleotidyltransferase with HDIG domain